MNGHAHVTVIAGGTSAVLEVAWETAVAEVMSRAREKLTLEGDGWEFYCTDGTTMLNKLQRTLGELRDQRICPRLEFEFKPVPPQSGAAI